MSSSTRPRATVGAVGLVAPRRAATRAVSEVPVRAAVPAAEPPTVSVAADGLAATLGAAISQLAVEQRLTATVVHDLANPIAILLGTCELLLDHTDLSPTAAASLRSIITLTEDMRGLVERLRAGR